MDLSGVSLGELAGASVGLRDLAMETRLEAHFVILQPTRPDYLAIRLRVQATFKTPQPHLCR